MEIHVKLLAWLYIIFGVLGIVAAACLAVVIAGGGLISGDEVAITVTGIVAVVIGGLIVLASIPGIIAGVGLLSFKNWARILAVALGILNLPGFPVGTALGVYTLYVMLVDETSYLFTSSI